MISLELCVVEVGLICKLVVCRSQRKFKDKGEEEI